MRADIAHRWQPGESGNRAGRPKGAKGRFSAEFVEALAADFAEHGAELIAKVRQDDPAAYLRVCAQLVPKEFLLAVQDERAQLTGNEWSIVVPMLRGVEAALPNAAELSPEEVQEFVVNALQAASAKVIEGQ